MVEISWKHIGSHFCFYTSVITSVCFFPGDFKVMDLVFIVFILPSLPLVKPGQMVSGRWESLGLNEFLMQCMYFFFPCLWLMIKKAVIVSNYKALEVFHDISVVLQLSAHHPRAHFLKQSIEQSTKLLQPLSLIGWCFCFFVSDQRL